MFRNSGIFSILQHTTGNVQIGNILPSGSSNNSNVAQKFYKVNSIQKRHRHVMEDGMEPHRVFLYDKKEGKRTSCDVVLQKFFRLRWGGWIRTIHGRDKDLYKKNSEKLRTYQKHFLCTAQQCSLLDKMVTHEYKEPHYYVDDPYEPYHNKENFMFTRTKPVPASKNVYQFIDD